MYNELLRYFIHSLVYSPQTKIKQKGYNMLSTIVMVLLAIWLSIAIVTQVAGIGAGYSLMRSFSQKLKDVRWYY